VLVRVGAVLVVVLGCFGECSHGAHKHERDSGGYVFRYERDRVVVVSRSCNGGRT